MKTKGLFRFICAVISLLLVFVTLGACANGDSGEQTTAADSASLQPGEHPQVKFTMENDGKSLGSFTMELYPEYAPITVENFLGLVGSGFYNGLTFHRVFPGFMAQGGDPDGTGMGGSTPIKGEFSANGVNNPLSHTRGVVSMARRGNDNDSGSSQFFICFSDDYTSVLDGQYAAFGKVIEGMEVVDSFCDVQLNNAGESVPTSPATPIIITSAEIVGK